MKPKYDDIQTIPPGTEIPVITKLKLSEAGNYQRRIYQLGFNSILWPVGGCVTGGRRIAFAVIKKLVTIYRLEKFVIVRASHE